MILICRYQEFLFLTANIPFRSGNGSYRQISYVKNKFIYCSKVGNTGHILVISALPVLLPPVKRGPPLQSIWGLKNAESGCKANRLTVSSRPLVHLPRGISVYLPRPRQNCELSLLVAKESLSGSFQSLGVLFALVQPS